ncbi:effector-associated domain 2-containing protein [Dactylosporangium sp. CA-092794]|uniref:VMAP-C domain-containing protein n=1 Tax=Dactylosporangium sp. CA-092794 TaxID=3239929 RepID=UPI003D91D42F
MTVPNPLVAAHRTHAVDEKNRLRRAAVDLLAETRMFQNAAERASLLELFRDSVPESLTVREVNEPRAQALEVVRACERHRGSLRQLAECLEVFDPATPDAQALVSLAEEWHAVEQFATYDLRWLRIRLSELRLSEVAVTVDLSELEACCRDGFQLRPAPTAWEMFAHLASLHAPAAGPPWLRLLHAVRQAVAPGYREQLDRLITELSADWQTPVRPAAPAVSGPRAAHGYVVIQFEKYGGDDDRFIMSHWRQWGDASAWRPTRGEDRLVGRGELEQEADALIREIETEWARQAGSVTIEVVLPRQLLGERVEAWRRKPRGRLANQYPLVIRSLERLRTEHWHLPWRSRWLNLAELAKDDEVVFCASPDQLDDQLEAALAQHSRVFVLVLSEPPAPDSVGELQLLIGLQSGIPCIVWRRDPLAGDAALCAVITSTLANTIVTGLGVAQLPARVAELRRQAWIDDPHDREGHPGHRLVILWDDPDRQPGRTGNPEGGYREVRG